MKRQGAAAGARVGKAAREKLKQTAKKAVKRRIQQVRMKVMRLDGY